MVLIVNIQSKNLCAMRKFIKFMREQAKFSELLYLDIYCKKSQQLDVLHK